MGETRQLKQIALEFTNHQKMTEIINKYNNKYLMVKNRIPTKADYERSLLLQTKATTMDIFSELVAAIPWDTFR